MKAIKLLAFLLALGLSQLYAQQSPVSAGGNGSSGSGSVSMSVGEIDFSYGSSSSGSVSQGVQQTEQSITINSLTSVPICAGTSLYVAFTARGVYSNSNVFTAQLSNSSGNFASPANIGTLQSAHSGTITATIPSNTAAGSGYRIRVVSNLPTTIGRDNGSNFTVYASPTAGSTVTSNINCNGGTGSILITASGGTPSYTGTGTFNVTANTYTYTVTDAHSCKSSTTISITQPTALVASTSVGTIACTGGTTSLTVSASGGTSGYSGIGTFTVAAGTYSYTVTDAHSCTSTTTKTVTQPTTVGFTTVKTNLSGCGALGSIVVSATGGSGTKTYSKDNGSTYQTSNTFSSLAAGNYSVKVKDGNACLSPVITNIISTNPPVTFTMTSTNASSCTTSNGSITVTASGGSSVFNYSKDGGTTYQSSNVFSGLGNGTYTIKVKDGNNCLSAATARVIGPSGCGGCGGCARVESNADDATTFVVYPNPATTFATIVFSTDKEEKYSLRMVDLTGRVIIYYDNKSVIGENQYQMNLSEVANGIYTIILKRNDGILQKKIVVQ